MHPLLSIWSQPTKTLRYLLEKKSVGYAFFILLLGSISSGSIAMATTGWFTGLPVFAIVIISIIITYIGALIGWIIMSALYTWIGKWLGGTGTFSEMIHITPASSIPMIWLAPMNFLLLGVYGAQLFETPQPLSFTNLPIGVYFLTNLITFGVGIYGTVISCKGIGVVHGFSAWRGLGVVAIIFGIFLLLGILFALTIGVIIFSMFSSF